jgi:uracil-DNA glycosylase
MIKLPPSWREPLLTELNAPYMGKLTDFLLTEFQAGKTIYPDKSEWLRALEATALESVRVVILGQDPYHGARQAHGLSFSVQHGTRIPPSLSNIFKELKSDLDISPSFHGNLEFWAAQGVLLLNAVLTVEAGQAAAHKNRGWEQFTDAIIRLLNRQPRSIVFVLWGNYAQKKAVLVDDRKHLILKSAHPSPLSAHNGFFGSKPFSKINDFLILSGQTGINWSLPA